MKQRVNYLYFFYSAGRIKIGISVAVEMRRREIAIHTPDPVETIGFIRGSYPLEKFVHAKLAEHRLTGEWFEDCEPVRALIGALMEKGGPRLIGFRPPPPPKSPELSDSRGAEVIPDIARLIWGERAIAELVAMTGAPEAICEKWMADGHTMPRLVRLAFCNVLFHACTTNQPMSFIDDPEPRREDWS